MGIYCTDFVQAEEGKGFADAGSDVLIIQCTFSVGSYLAVDNKTLFSRFGLAKKCLGVPRIGRWVGGSAVKLFDAQVLEGRKQ